MSTKVIIIIIVSVILLGGVGFGVYALRNSNPLTTSADKPLGVPQSIQATKILSNEANIQWTSEGAVISVVKYGTSSTDLSQTATELTSTKNHLVKLRNLKPATTYYYTVVVGQEIYDNGGTPWSFKTIEDENKITREDVEKALGTSNPKYDFNKDGIVNALDIRKFLKQTPTP